MYFKYTPLTSSIIIMIVFLKQEDCPFDWFSELLMGDLFSSAWETRQGAATGLWLVQ